ncbi:MYND-type domain-containing protein [Mycena venus]|uniref:MYND-type domain-containing protein n=1 Tax=Mycena venus TaxID=2733690 RepID=A0A8H6YRW6_9AGAR|nr:MYND-type domain-containing protein [Mycena venus]
MFNQSIPSLISEQMSSSSNVRGGSTTDVMDPRSLRLFLATLNDPTDPQALCCIALLHLVDMFGQVIKSVQKKDIQPSLIFRATMRFFTLLNPTESLACVKKNISTCRCNLADPLLQRLHSAFSGPAPARYADLISALALQLTAGLGDLQCGRFHKKMKVRDTESQPWPISESDLLGRCHTCRDTLAVLLLWAEDIHSGVGTFNIIAELLRLWPPFRTEFAANPRALRLATDHLKFAFTRYDVLPNIDDFGFFYPISAIARLFVGIATIRPLPLVCDILKPLLAELYPLSIRLQGMAPQLAQYTPHLEAFHYLLGVTIASRMGVQRPLSGDGLHMTALASMVAIRTNRTNPKCMNIGCSAPPGSKTSQCARCTVVRYCGSECQRNAWRDPVLPHKRLCDAIHSLRCALQLEGAAEWSDWLLDDFKSSDSSMELKLARFADLCRSKNLNPGLSQIIRETMIEMQTKLNL